MEGVDTTPLGILFLIEREIRDRSEIVACYETKPILPEFKVLDQPLTFELSGQFNQK